MSLIQMRACNIATDRAGEYQMPLTAEEKEALQTYAKAFTDKKWNPLMINARVAQSYNQLGFKPAAKFLYDFINTSVKKYYEAEGAVMEEPIIPPDNPVVKAVGEFKPFITQDVIKLIQTAAAINVDVMHPQRAHLADSVADAKVKAQGRPWMPITTVYTSFDEAAEDLTDLLNKNFGDAACIKDNMSTIVDLGYGGTRKPRIGWKWTASDGKLKQAEWTQVEATVKILSGSISITHFTPREPK